MQNDIKQEIGTNFIEYAVAVNTDRANPDARSGLKPVAKRIIFSTFEKGRLSSKPHVKAARIVGDTMGDYHPHGDSSIYGALVRLSQDWIMRYPLIDWHGNNGNIMGDGAAHMRYTEARLTKLAEEGLLAGIKKRNVDFILNYDESQEEPITLPAIFPNLLCNPNTGIGVAMACNWLPHNLREVAQCIYDYMDGKEINLPGPDFPTGGIVINKNDIPAIMKTGRGSVKVRGKYKIDKQNIIFYEIPYGTTIEGLLNEIGEACDKKEIEGIEEIKDNSNKKGLKIIIECQKGANPENIVKKLFVKTSLQTSISYNQVALVGKTPTELNLIDCIKIYIEHNIDCLKRELTFDIEKAKARLHTVEGLLIALEDIDNVIKLIKSSENVSMASVALQTQYKLTEIQAKAILDMKLAKLAKLEKIELEKEKKELVIKIAELELHLRDRNLQEYDIRERLENIVKKYGDERRTELVQIDIPKGEKEIEEVVPEDVVVILTKSGNIKRIPKASFKTQKRGGKGVKNQDEAILSTISTNTIDNLLLFTSKGKMYKLLVNNIPIGTNASKGINIDNLIKIDADDQVVATTSLYNKTNAKYIIFFTKNGLVKKTLLSEYTEIKKTTGVAAIKLKENDEIANITFALDEDMIVVTKNGQSIHIENCDIPSGGRVTMGSKVIKLDENDYIIAGLPIHKDTDYLAIVTDKGYGKKIKLEEFPVQARNGKGVKVYKSDSSIGGIVSVMMIDDQDEILIIGRPNSICIKATDMPLSSRVAQGNIMIKGEVITAVKL